MLQRFLDCRRRPHHHRGCRHLRHYHQGSPQSAIDPQLSSSSLSNQLSIVEESSSKQGKPFISSTPCSSAGSTGKTAEVEATAKGLLQNSSSPNVHLMLVQIPINRSNADNLSKLDGMDALIPAGSAPRSCEPPIVFNGLPCSISPQGFLVTT